MSVINQMLKDLDERTPEHGYAPNAVAVNQKASTIKIVAISLTVLLILNVLGFYIWDLQTRVELSERKSTEYQNKAQQIEDNQQLKSIEITSVNDTQPVATKAAISKERDETQNNIEQLNAQKNSNKQIESPTVSIAKVDSPTNKVQQEHNQTAQKQNSNAEKAVTIIKTEKVSVTPKVKPVVSVIEKDAAPSKMTVSRRQLTTEELVAQKLTKAEKAVNTNQITKAEKLFEEVLILQPSKAQARKNLAALWFGRKSYQQAINLLSQGIALDKSNSELRMLKARIQIQQGQHKGAYNTLKPLSDLEDLDYQIMLANVAQQIEAYPSAIMAYNVLIKMQPYSGKWHLGLAIVYDRDSQFSLAEQGYAMALSKNDLSSASAEFAQQRMLALGE